MAIRVLIQRPDGTRGYDVTDRVEALQWSNVNPGGHERATFNLKGDWGGGFPEVARGNLVRIEDGAAELFTGRIDELDPQVQDAEQIGVTAYGLGVRLKDNTMREIYVDRDLTKWRAASVARKLAGTTGSVDINDGTTGPDSTTGLYSMNLTLQGAWARASTAELWYDSVGIPLGEIQFAWKFNDAVSSADSHWLAAVELFDKDDNTGTNDNVTFNSTSRDGFESLLAGPTTRMFGLVLLEYTVAAGSAGVNYSLFFDTLAVYGYNALGLDQQGSLDHGVAPGFFASQIVEDVCARLAGTGTYDGVLPDSGIRARQIDTSDFIITQLVFSQDTAHEDVITAVSKYHDVDWGVWGSQSVYEDPTIGYLDWTARDGTEQTWIAWRDECDEVDLHTEVGSTFNQAAVNYTDPTGQQHRLLRTLDSTALDDAGIASRTVIVDGGTLDTNGAEQLGDAALALSAGQPVSRGSATITQPIKHLSGLRPPHFMRADGANLAIPDAFPDRDAFALQTSADRRSIFPIKRVTVDASGDVPSVTVELDQTHDLLSILLARLQLGVGVAQGGSG